LDRFHNPFNTKGLLQGCVCTQFLCYGKEFAPESAGHRNNLRIRPLLSQASNRFQTLLLGHDQVDDEKIRRFLVHSVDGLLAVGCFEHFVPSALEHSAEQTADLLVIINNQNMDRAAGTISSTSRTFRASFAGVKGFWINATPGSKTP
jgi:hypothetical protein